MALKSYKSNRNKQKGIISEKRQAVFDFESIELENEVQDLKRELLQSETRLFELQKGTFKRRRVCGSRKQIKSSDNNHIFSKSVQNMIEDTDRARLETNLDLYSQTTGIKVPYCDDMRCCIMFEICTGNVAIAEHAIEILKNTESSKVGKCSMPPGFQYKTIVKQHPEVCTQNFILEIHQGLVAYYSRIDQLKTFKEKKPSDVKLFHSSDGDMVELSFLVGHMSFNWIKYVSIRLIYKITSDRPDNIEIQAEGLETLYLKVLESHLESFFLHSLEVAFDKLRSDFSVDKGDFAIIMEKQIIDPKDRPKAPKSKTQNTNDDAELQINEASINEAEFSLSMNKSLWDLIYFVKNKHKHPGIKERERTNKFDNLQMPSANYKSNPEKAFTRPSKVVPEPQLLRLRSSRCSQVQEVVDGLQLSRHSVQAASGLQQLSLNSSKYLPSESDDTSEEERPVRKQTKPLKEIGQSLEIKMPLLNIPARNLRSSKAVKIPDGRPSNSQRNKKIKKTEEESEEDELDIKERNQAISKVTQWLRSTPLPEGDILE